MFFQKKNSKKVSSKDSDRSPKKDKESWGKSHLIDRAKGGIDAFAGSLHSAKNDTEAKAAKLQEDVKGGIETILHKGSPILEKAKEEIGGHAEATHLKEQEQGSVEQESKGMEAFSAVIDNVKKNPEVVEQVEGEIASLAEAFHLGNQESESHEKAKEGETTEKVHTKETHGTSGDINENTPVDKIKGPSVVERAVEEIQAVVATVQQATRSTETQTATAAAAEGTKVEETKAEGTKETPQKRIDFLGFFAMLFERFCSPADKKKD